VVTPRIGIAMYPYPPSSLLPVYEAKDSGRNQMRSTEQNRDCARFFPYSPFTPDSKCSAARRYGLVPSLACFSPSSSFFFSHRPAGAQAVVPGICQMAPSTVLLFLFFLSVSRYCELERNCRQSLSSLPLSGRRDSLLALKELVSRVFLFFSPRHVRSID